MTRGSELKVVIGGPTSQRPWVVVSLLIIDCSPLLQIEKAGIHYALAISALLNLVEEFLSSPSEIGEKGLITENCVANLTLLQMRSSRAVNQREVRR